nr:hypothetical protein [Streptomyces violens]
MSAQCLQEGEQALEDGVLQQGVGVSAVLEVDGDDQGGLLACAGRLAKASADGLDGVDDAVSRGGENHGVDIGHVDAFVEDAHIGEHRACPVGVGEVFQQLAAPVPRLLTVDRLRPQVFDAQFLSDLQGGGGQGGGEGLREGDAVVEHQDAAQLMAGDRAQDGNVDGGVTQSVVVGAEDGVAGGEDGVQVAVVDDGQDDLVVGENAAFDGLGHAQFENSGTEDFAVVHGGQRNAVRERREVAGTCGNCGVPDPGCGGHVEADLGGDGVVVVDGAPAGSESGAGAVGLIDDHQVPGGQTIVLVGVFKVMQGAVGGEHGDRAAGLHRADDRLRAADHHRLAPGQSALGLAQGAQSECGPRTPGVAPAADGLCHQVLRRHQDQDGAVCGQGLRGLLGDQRLAAAAGGHDRHPLLAGGRGVLDRGKRLSLVRA